MAIHGRHLIGALTAWVGTTSGALAQSGGAPAGEVSAAVVADAAGRASLTGGATPTGGHDGRFFVQSADGSYRFELRGEAQFRYYAVFGAEGDDADADEDVTTGFEKTRHRLDFRAQLVNPRLRFRMRGDFDRDGGVFELVDAYGSYDLGEGWSVQWGQYKVVYDREFAQIRGTSGLAVERSLTSILFRVNRSQGVQMQYDAGDWRAYGTVSDGRSAANSEFGDPSNADIALTGRFEARFGEAGWRQYGDATSFRGAKTGLLLGAGAHWQQDGNDLGAPGATGTTNLFMYTADASVEGDGWNLMAAWYGRVIDSPVEMGEDTLHDFGFVLQAGYFLCEHAEIFGRYEHIFPDDDRAGGSDDFPGFVLGGNWYMIPGSHAVKFTAQGMYFPEAQVDSNAIVGAPNSNLGLLPDVSGDVFAIVGQVQLLF